MTPANILLANLNELNENNIHELRPALAHSKNLSALTEEGLQYLIRALAFADAEFSNEIENLLVSAGSTAVPMLVKALMGNDNAVASTAAMAIIRLNKTAENALLKAYNNLEANNANAWRFEFVLKQLGLNANTTVNNHLALVK